MTLTTSSSCININENVIKCSVQSWEMINAAFAEEVKREKKKASLRGVIVKRGAHGVPSLTSDLLLSMSAI